MPEEKDKIKKLYDTFVSDGYDMESEEDFRKNLLDSTKRKAAYDALVKDGYDMEPFEEFESNIGFGKERTSSQQSGNSASGTVEEPISPANEQTWQPTEKEKVAMLTETDRIMNDVKSHTQTFNERIDNMQEYGINPGLQTKEGKMIFNPESGKLEKTFLTPAGNRYYSKSLADMESFQYRQAADMSIGGQLRKANLRLQELKAKQAERASEVHKEWAEETENNKAPLAAILGAATYTPRQQSDKENRALSVAIRETEELIKNLEEQKDRENGVDVGFWRGFGRTMGDVRTWDFGMGDMRDAFTMMNADELKKENATEGEREAHDAMMGAIHEKQQAEERYSGNADFWNRAGVMTGYMPSFMLDFVLTGGGFNGLSSFSKGSTRLATKVISKETAEKMAQQGFKSYIKENGAKGLGRYATDWTIKALGTTADDLLVRAPLMANTVQAGKTTADIIDRKLGDVVVDENGNYDFSNDKTWGDAIWQSEANAIIENYSEMFGAHLDPVFTLGNMSKLANVVGAKRIGAVLSKADASALNGIMGQTHQMFNKMGMSDYVGEVSEEYYGQLWRTMLNLDDAYQQNPDGTRTNLLAIGQFHGDIWGGMALSMGLMGAGKATLSGAQYASMKHGVNKADARVTELLGKEIWEPLRATIDLTTNDDIGSVAEGIVNDKDFSDDERAAVLTYMERSLMMRGFNLGTLAQKRGGEQDEDVQSMNESYIDGYNLADPQEMTDAKNMRDYQRQRVSAIVDENTLGFLDIHPMNALEEMRNNGLWRESELETVLDYLNAKQVYDGMIQRVRDDIDARVEQSNAMVDARTNRTTGMIQGATMKQDDRRVYVVGGNLVQYADGSGIDNRASDGSIIVRDAETGALEQVSPDAVLNIDEPLNPSDEKMTAEEAIIQQFAQEASDKIDGVVTFNPGDTYTITGDDAQIQVQIVANEDGIVDNGDGTVNVSDGVNIFPLAKETIQQQADAANLARVAQFEQQRTIENAERKQEMQEAERPQYALNDIVSLTDENGVTVRGNITADADADGKYEVFTEAPINGKRVNLFTRDELDNILLEHNGVAFERPAENESNNGVENIPENDNNAPQNIPAMQRIPKDEQGNPLYEQADSDTAWDAIVEQTEGDEDMAQTVADGMVADKEEALKKLEKAKSKGGNSIAEKIASEKERKAAIDAAKQELLVWQKIAGTAKRRKMEADDERRRIADEAAALRKAEEEKLRAEREEAERIEREVLNGVPDMVDDKPQDARARGYRRMNGHKIDRQEPVQALQGKEVSVKFSDDAIVGGRVAVIDANLLQPSHIQGVRNPLHFIDEAQPKERNDEASVLSARKIAGNIRPEEITSSVTAYTGAPTVNARGEAIQGNNRSDALRIMWENHPEQAALYKQYLKDHAEEFGLQAEDIEAMEHPVLVNMVDVDDAEAIRLGQYVAQDTESGGVERIKPKNALQRMGAEMRSFANLLLRTSDDEMSFAGLVDSNGANVLKWMSQRGFITPTQYKSAFDSKGNLTPESKNDLRGIMYQSIFKDGSTRLEEMFNVLPVKAQKAILATAFRDYDSPNSERMVDEIQNSVRAYYALSQDKMFAEAKNFKEARTAIESWKRQYQMDDVTGESYLPADNFSNFVLHLAAMYKGESQSFIQNTFGKIYDLIQGTQEETLFEQPDNTPRTLVQAIKEAFNLDYNGQQRSNVLVGDTATSQRGQQGSNGTLAPRERVENGNGTTDDTGRTESIGGQSEIESSLSQEEMLSSDDTDNQLSAKIARRIEVQEDDWIESGKYGDTYKQTIIVDGTHKVIKVDAPDTKGNYIGSAYEYDGQTFGDLLDVLNYIDTSLSLANAVAVAEKETDTTPTEKQKEAGNYKKGHVQVGTFNITIENPKGSVRSGIDTEGNKWETIMQNTYGYIRGTEGVDGDHIDVFLSDDIDGWNGRRVFVVDQYNEDGSFDEHKVMLGFNETDDAEAAYFANYDSDWANNHKTVVTAVNLEDFEKWIDSSHRKTKAFAEYKSVKSVEEQSSSTQVDRLSEIKSRIEELHKEQEAAHGQSDIFEEARIISEINDLFTEQRKLEQNNSNEETTTPTDAAYTITQAQYTTKRGKVLDMHLVKFNDKLRDTVRKHTTMFAKQLKGWWDKEKQGFMMRSKEDAERLAEYATDAQSQPPLSLSDLLEVNDGNVQFAESQLLETSKQEEKQEYSPVWQYSVSVDKETGLTTLKRDDVSGPIPIGDGRFNYTANSPEEMLEIVRNPKNFNQELRDAVETILENKVKIREIVRTEKAEATEQESKPENNPSGNRLVTDERYAELRERMRKKLLGQMNMGIDPEILAIGTEMAVYHLEKGARKFTEYATAMVADLGDAIRPYLKAFYNGARDLPEVAENGLDADMTPYDEVQQFDVANFDKKSIDALATAETVTRETEVEQEAEIAQERIKKSRPARKKNEKKAVNSQQSNELGLFDDLIDNNKNNEHGLQRTDAERSEGLSANGNRHGQGLSRGTETGSESEQQAGRGTDNEGERTSDAVNRIVRPRLSDAITEKKNTHNNHSERGKDHAPTSVDARIEANIKAIELAKQLLESGERATEKQMQTLRKFSGWGGLGKAFNEGTSYAPNPIAKKLRELLGEKAYQEAIMSANSAYYTPAYVVDTLWDIAEQMGFNGGNILEGSAGIGNILGQMPTNISEHSDIHAIEIDRTSGGILSLLYPDAKVEIQGFEQTRIPNGSVDLAITNVPFVTGLRVNDTTGDKDLSKKFHNIHDFCIAKNVRKLREGGLGIFITSNGTLDNSKKLRDWIVNEGGSDFVGAFRMHNKTFGGIGVTSDIVVIRKRVNGQKSVHVIDVSDVSGERMAEYDTGETRKVKGKETPVIKQLSMDYNRYFIEHPENMAGEMHFAFEKGDTFRPTSKGLYPAQDKKQEQMLSEFVHSFKAEEFGERNAGPVTDVMPDKKIGEIFVRDGKLFINSTASAQPLEVNANKVKGHTKVECFEAYTAIKEALAEVLSYQTENESDEGLKPLLDKLNKAYDDFVGTYGHFNKNTAIAFLRNDVDYANVFALEKFEETADEKGNRIQKFEKTDVFSKRVVEKDKEPTPANVKDGIIASIFKFGRVDIPYIAEQLGTGIEDVKKEIIESGYGFEDPVSRQMEASYQYLSGNIREKLRQAEENNENGEFDRNIKALQEVMPMEIPAHLIDFTLGSSWIDPKLYEDFVKERTEVDVRFTAVGGTWFMKEPYFTNYEKNRAMGVTSEMLGRTIMGHTLIEAAIQNRSITVSTTKKHYDGTTETITDKEATQACAAKIDEIRQDFKDWARQKMQSDPEMSERMERIYNDMFNNFVPMSIPDEFVPEYFGGASHKFKMRPHQGRAIVRGTQQPLLLAHEVGTGKTFTLISTAMEMRRLGTARKPMIVVQNATVGQFVASAKELYPNAKILTLEEADRSAEGRKNFYAKIRYNDWDMIVVPQSTFEFIPDSEEREMTFVQDKIEEKMLILEQMKEEDPDGKNMITRQAEREIELLEEQLAGLADNASKKRTANDEKKRAVALQNAEVKAMEMLDRRTDDVENFDDMGIDALLVDEAHEYKHLGFATAMQRGVKGVDPSYSKKSQGVFLKTQAVLEKNNGRNVIFATGTPISNTAAEIWTFMRYLMPADTMKEYGIYYFDDFVRNFGNIQQMLEFTTSGKFKENNRFAGYVNLPELVRIWSGVSDTVLTKEAGGVKDKIPEMDASVETANNISASEEDDELKREGGGAYTDDEVSYENDPVAKLLGQSRRTAKQRREFAQRERQRMAERVEILAEKLHLDNVEIVTDASVLDGKKQRAKGFYSKSTGKITIVIPNHTSAFDVEQTLLHEAVAHYGLRQLFGEHFDTFLDNVFNNADENIRKRIVDMAAKNGWNFRKATEEYLASLAEQTEFENINASWWRQIKDFFLNMLHKIGFDDFRGVTLTDNELRYILWRSYENLAEPGRYRSILGEAADVAKQYELGVGNYSDTNRNPNFAADSNDELYRDGSPEMHERELARDRYERRVKTGMFQSQEALQDSMLGLKEAMQAILGQGTNIEDVDGFENAYLGENRLSSVNKAEADAFAHTLFKPMLDEVAKLARTEAEREELTDYMMAKHGLERNTYMRNEAINNGATNADQTDYAGLTALTGMDNVTDAETEAQIMVNDYEQAHDTADLWKKVNAVSKAILSKSYECGMMSKATFDKISDMYDFYIPLRGFDEKTSTEAYAYLTHKQSAFNAPIKKAEGRRSKADDPFANLQSMAEGAIMQGNRNKLVKQRFLNFALNHPSDLVSVSDIWVEYDTVADEWKPVFPDNIDSTDTPEVVERKMLDFETKMESLAQQYPDRYKHGKDTVNIPYRIVESRDMRQHQIVVKRGGRDYVITINGNPRAAQALNGQTNPDNDMSGAIGAILRAGENINRQLSAFYTTRNPDFIVSNFMRDMLYTNTMTWIRESPNYALRFHRNYMYANPVRIKQLLAKHRKGTLDMSNKTEAMFHQFMMNGGETGYANIRDIEQHKNDIRRELKKSNGKIPVKKAWDLLGERFDEYNRAVENCARFAAFMTSREMGRSIDRAIYDAKEISVNFNKKGSGAKFYDSTGQTKAGNASALVSGLGRSGYVFWNAAIQGTANFGRQMKRHPAKAFTGIAAMFLLGAIVAYLGGDDDDDDDKNAYYNLPEYVRRSNILFRAGNSWVSIPLPVEYRAFYGMGELMISVLNGKEHLTGEEIAEAITGQATQILPIDFLEGGGGLNAFVPSAYKPLWEAYVAEKSWTGMPLYKDTPYNKDMPEWTKAYKSANKYIVGLANAMNEATGGDPYTKGTIDFNPAKIEYMLNGYFGGVFGTIDKLSKTAETITDNREYDPRSFLLVNRLVKAGDERTEYRAVNNEYFRLKEEHDRLKSRLKHYEEDTDNDIFDYAEKIDFLYNSPEYERYEIFEDYRRDIDDLYNELNDTVDDEERKNIEAELNELKKEMIEEMNKTRK